MRGRVVAITGASTGIGRALAEAWAARGARLVLNARSVERLEEAVVACRARGAEVVAVAGDVTEPAIQAAFVEAARASFARLDVLVNNAGVGLYGAIEAIPEAMLREVFELNVVAPLALVKRALPALEASRGTIVMMSSIAGLVAMPRTGGYAATKFALEALSSSLRAELAAQRRGVRVCVVRPGLTDTPFGENARLAEGAPTRASLGTGTAARLLRRGVPTMSAEEVARATIRAVERHEPEVDLTLSARAIATLGRVSRPALRAVLARMAPRMGLGPKVAGGSMAADGPRE